MATLGAETQRPLPVATRVARHEAGSERRKKRTVEGAVSESGEGRCPRGIHLTVSSASARPAAGALAASCPARRGPPASPGRPPAKVRSLMGTRSRSDPQKLPRGTIVEDRVAQLPAPRCPPPTPPRPPRDFSSPSRPRWPRALTVVQKAYHRHDDERGAAPPLSKEEGGGRALLLQRHEVPR